jgi:DNA-directed RNA polymerase subunit RPC12/RpoP
LAQQWRRDMAWRSERRDSFTCSSQRLPGSPCLRLSPRRASASLYMGNVRPREADDSSIYRYTRIRCSACNTSSTSILPLFTASATRSRSHDARRQASDGRLPLLSIGPRSSGTPSAPCHTRRLLRHRPSTATTVPARPNAPILSVGSQVARHPVTSLRRIQAYTMST